MLFCMYALLHLLKGGTVLTPELGCGMLGNFKELGDTDREPQEALSFLLNHFCP